MTSSPLPARHSEDDEQAVLRATEHDDVVGRDRLAGARRVPGGDRRAQRRPAGGLGVMGVAGAHGPDGRIHHRGRRVEVRIADAQHDDILARGLRLPGLPVQYPRIGAVGRDTLDDLRKARPHRAVHSKASATHFEHHHLAARAKILERALQRLRCCR